MSQPLFEVRHLNIALHDDEVAATPGPDSSDLWLESEQRVLPRGWQLGISDLNFSVETGEVLAIVGESGGGKSLSLMGSFDLLGGSARVLSGEVFLDGRRIYPLPAKRKRSWRIRKKGGRYAFDDAEWRKAIGTEVGFLFQNAITAWEPTTVIGDQAGEALGEHTDLTQEEIEARVYDALGEAQLPKGSKFFSFAHQMSRGEAQRAMLASALVKSPRLLVADEPLSGLDVSVAAAILDLIRDLQLKRNMAMILVTHDLATVARIANRVAILYAGSIVETGAIEEIFHHPKHPYTAGLLGSIPSPYGHRLRPIEGDPPRLLDVAPDQCAFAPRCPYVAPSCLEGRPELEPAGTGTVACFRHDDLNLRGINP